MIAANCCSLLLLAGPSSAPEQWEHSCAGAGGATRPPPLFRSRSESESAAQPPWSAAAGPRHRLRHGGGVADSRWYGHRTCSNDNSNSNYNKYYNNNEIIIISTLMATIACDKDYPDSEGSRRSGSGPDPRRIVPPPLSPPPAGRPTGCFAAESQQGLGRGFGPAAVRPANRCVCVCVRARACGCAAQPANREYALPALVVPCVCVCVCGARVRACARARARVAHSANPRPGPLGLSSRPRAHPETPWTAAVTAYRSSLQVIAEIAVKHGVNGEPPLPLLSENSSWEFKLRDSITFGRHLSHEPIPAALRGTSPCGRLAVADARSDSESQNSPRRKAFWSNCNNRRR